MTAQPSAVGRDFLTIDGRRGALAGLESATVAQLRAGTPVFLDLALLGVCSRPLAVLDGDWMAAHPDMGLVAPGPVLRLTGPDFAELAAGRIVEREIAGTALWTAFPVRIAQADTVDALQERFHELSESDAAHTGPQAGRQRYSPPHP